MSSSENYNNDALVEELLKSIQSTTSLIQGLMSEIKSNATALATLETKLESLNESAKSLTKIVRDDNGNKSVLTRLAIIENDLVDLFSNYKEFKTHVYIKLDEIKEKAIKTNEDIRKEMVSTNDKEEDSQDFNKRKLLATLQIAPGIIALILVLIKIFWGIDISI